MLRMFVKFVKVVAREMAPKGWILFFESGEVLDEFVLFSFHLVQLTCRVAVNLTTSLIDFI